MVSIVQCYAAASVSAVLLLTVFVPTTRGAESLEAVISDFWKWRLKEFPEFSTFAGEHSYDDKLEVYTWETHLTRKEKAAGFSKRLSALDRSSFAPADQLNYELLDGAVNTYLGGYEWMSYSVVNPVNYLEGVASNEIDGVLQPSNQTAVAYRNVLARVKAYPAQIAQQIDLMRRAINGGLINHNVSMSRVQANLNSFMAIPFNESDFYTVFGEEKMNNVADLSSSDVATIRQEALQATEEIYKSWQTLNGMIINEYMPKTRSHYGVSGFPRGQEYYQACLRWHTTTEMTPEQVHGLGLSEVKRIRGDIQKVMDEVKFTGNLTQFQDFLRTNASFYFTTEAELLAEYKRLITEVDGKLSQVFGKDTMPDVPCNVEPMKTDGPGGQYSSPLKPGDPGRFIVNLRQPEKRAKFSMMALTLHEANPGHHYQSVAQLNAPGLPDFRRYTDFSKYFSVPYHFPFYTAYAEGWALYAESLGEEIGAYATAYDRFGRYSSEIFRASRLVVDTGLHAFNWTRQEAVDYMVENTFDVKEQLENEIDRYITWPGQACAYKIGELKIKELRRRAEEKLGKAFSIKEFHSQVLQMGSVPLTTLENRIDQWITTKSKSNSAAHMSCSLTLLLPPILLVIVQMLNVKG